MKAKLNNYTVFYVRGFGSPFKVSAINEHEAAIAALAEYRRHYGFVETVHEWPLEKVVAKVVLAK